MYGFTGILVAVRAIVLLNGNDLMRALQAIYTHIGAQFVANDLYPSTGFVIVNTLGLRSGTFTPEYNPAT
jgi:hypothetical protein